MLRYLQMKLELISVTVKFSDTENNFSDSKTRFFECQYSFLLFKDAHALEGFCFVFEVPSHLRRVGRTFV